MDVLTRAFPSLFDYHRPDSFVTGMRQRRALHFRSLLERLPRDGTVRILDIGGTHHYWSTVGLPDPARFHVTLVNLEPEALPPGARGFEAAVGDAARFPFASGSFDVVFSNSVIEHVGSPARQREMAEKVRRVGRRYYVQTPSRWFPLEPHSHLPLFQFLPRPARAALIQRFDINYFPRKPTFEECLAVSDSTILLDRRGFVALFPEARIRVERLFGIVKSYTAVHGWEP